MTASSFLLSLRSAFLHSVFEIAGQVDSTFDTDCFGVGGDDDDMMITVEVSSVLLADLCCSAIVAMIPER
jgi:hypothetical protein